MALTQNEKKEASPLEVDVSNMTDESEEFETGLMSPFDRCTSKRGKADDLMFFDLDIDVNQLKFPDKGISFRLISQLNNMRHYFALPILHKNMRMYLYTYRQHR